MSGLKYNYYIGVKTNDGIRLVTKINNRENMSYWKADEKPQKFTLSTAKDISWGLCINGFESFVITTLEEYEKQPFITVNDNVN